RFSRGAKAREGKSTPRACTKVLLKFDFSTSFFKLLLSFFSFGFSNTFFDVFRCAVNQIFSFFQAQTGDFTNNFNHANFVCADFSQVNGELSLLSSSSASVTASSRCNSNSCSSSGNTKFFFQVSD